MRHINWISISLSTSYFKNCDSFFIPKPCWQNLAIDPWTSEHAPGHHLLLFCTRPWKTTDVTSNIEISTQNSYPFLYGSCHFRISYCCSHVRAKMHARIYFPPVWTLANAFRFLPSFVPGDFSSFDQFFSRNSCECKFGKYGRAKRKLSRGACCLILRS